MWERLLPRTVDHRYRGHPLALWLVLPITVMTLGRSLAHFFEADGGGLWKPIEILSTPPGARFNFVMIGLASVMSALSLRARGRSADVARG